MKGKREFNENQRNDLLLNADYGKDQSTHFYEKINVWVEQYKKYDFSRLSANAKNYFEGLDGTLDKSKEDINSIFTAAEEVENYCAKKFEDIAFEMGLYANRINALCSVLQPAGPIASGTSAFDRPDFAERLEAAKQDILKSEVELNYEHYSRDENWKKLLEKPDQEMTDSEYAAFALIKESLDEEDAKLVALKLGDTVVDFLKKDDNSFSVIKIRKDPQELDIFKGSIEGSAKFNSPSYKDPEAKEIIEQKEIPFKQNAHIKETGKEIPFAVAPEYAKKKATILEGEIKGSIESSLVDYNTSGKNEFGEYSVNAKVGTAEMHGSLSAGLYIFDKNGKKMLAPSVNAEIGASVCVLSAEISGKVGSDMLGAYGGAEIAVGKAEVKGTASVAFFNEKGEVNIQAKAKASAEAIAFEAQGRVGATVLGAEVGVTGSVTVGVGAHAEVGIVDGVVKVDIGASLGIGVSVGFEVDVGGMVDAVCGGAKAAWEAFTGWF